MRDMFGYSIPDRTIALSQYSVPIDEEIEESIEHFIPEVGMISEGTVDIEHAGSTSKVFTGEEAHWMHQH